MEQNKEEHVIEDEKYRFFVSMGIGLLLFYFLLFVIVLCYFLYKGNALDARNFFLFLFMVFFVVYLFGESSMQLIDKICKKKKGSEYREYLLNELHVGSENEENGGNNIQIKSADSNISKNEEIKESKNEIIEYSDNAQKHEKKDVLNLMLKNNDEITEYFTISKRHAKSSYRFSVFAAITGMLMLAFAVYGAMVIDNIDLTIIGVVGGAVTELVAGVVLWIHNKSAMQLNYYYDALHENEKFLAAINMTDKLSEDKQEEMYIEIIKKQIERHNDKTGC